MSPRPARFARRLDALLLALTLGFVPSVHAQLSGTWLRIGDPPNPTAFAMNAAAYDSAGDRVLVYNPTVRYDDTTVPASEVWELSLSTPAAGWHRLATTGPAPAGRMFACAVVDAPNQRLLLYGGTPDVGGTAMSNDLYALSLTGPPTWSVVSTAAGTMPVRYGAVMFLDEPGHRLVLHGGIAVSGVTRTRVYDVWTLPLDGAPAWSQVPTPQGPPPTRTNPQFAWDAARSRLLMHGGFNSSGVGLTDTWALNMGAMALWTPLATVGEQVPRAMGGAWVDAAGDRLVLGPGTAGVYPPPANELTTYELPLGPDSEWSAMPGVRGFDVSSYDYRTVFDARRRRLVTVSSAFTQAFALTDGSGWARQWPTDPPLAPGQSSGHVLVADPAHEAIWQVGGSETSNLGDLWKLDATGAAQWIRYPLSHPLPLGGHAAALDAAGQRILVSSFGSSPPELLAVDITGAPVAAVFPAAGGYPLTRVEHTVVVDPVRRQLLLFGGQLFAPHFSGTSHDDVWSVSLDDLSTWTRLWPTGTTPPARGTHFAFYDDVHERMVVLGGWQQAGGPIRHYLHDAWALSLAGPPAWTRLDSVAWDPPTTGSLSYDPVTHQLFLFHANDWYVPATGYVYVRGVNDGDAWTLVQAPGDQPAFSAPSAYAPWCGRLVVSGTSVEATPWDEVWALQLDQPVPALASLEQLDVTFDRVAIAWRADVPPGSRLSLSRRVGDAEWLAIAEPIADGDGRVAYEDRDVPPGTHLTYRLNLGKQVLAETAVDVPASSGLVFAGARPSPARGAMSLAFSLPAASPVTFELFDVRGARVLARDLGVRSAGEHVWTWPETAKLGPGLYLSRLTTRTGQRTAKVLRIE